MAGQLLATTPIHLGLGAMAHVEPAFTGMEWYADYGARHVTDGAEGRLVSMHCFTQPWDSWEMHPAGDEVVLCTAGEITLHQQWPDGRVETVTIGTGEYAINPPGVWHTAISPARRRRFSSPQEREPKTGRAESDKLLQDLAHQA